MSMATALRIRVTGTVQGVFFRAETQLAAQNLQITGWVQNLPDGSVLIHAEGEPKALEDLTAWCHDGPPQAKVDQVQVDVIEPVGYTKFTIQR